MPPNKGMELTVKSDTPLAKRRARARRVCLQLIPGVRWLDSDVSATPDSAQRQPPFFQVTVLKLVVLMTLTWGAYSLPWLYLHWDAVRSSTGRRFSVGIRALLFPFIFIFPLFREVRSATIAHGTTRLFLPEALAAAHLTFSAFSFWVASWWSLLAFISVLPLAIVQARVNSLHAALGFDPRTNGRFSLLNIVFCVLGGVSLGLFVWPLVHWLVEAALWKLRA